MRNHAIPKPARISDSRCGEAARARRRSLHFKFWASLGSDRLFCLSQPDCETFEIRTAVRYLDRLNEVDDQVDKTVKVHRQENPLQQITQLTHVVAQGRCPKYGRKKTPMFDRGFVNADEKKPTSKWA